MQLLLCSRDLRLLLHHHLLLDLILIVLRLATDGGGIDKTTSSTSDGRLLSLIQSLTLVHSDLLLMCSLLL